jgi:BRCA1-associated protein
VRRIKDLHASGQSAASPLSGVPTCVKCLTLTQPTRLHSTNLLGRYSRDCSTVSLPHYTPRQKRIFVQCEQMPYFFHIVFELYPPKSSYAAGLPELSNWPPIQLESVPAWIPPPACDIFTTSLPSHPKPISLPAVAERSRPTSQNFRKKTKSEQKGKETLPHTHPDWRFGRVRVESVDMETTKSARRIPAQTAVSDSSLDAGTGISKAQFVPLKTKITEFGYGVVHLYRDSAEAPRLFGSQLEEEKDSLAEQKPSQDDLTTVSILAVPSYMTPSDFMGFVGEGTRNAVSHLRMVRTGKVNRYMVLMKFRTKAGARKFVTEYNGKVFNSMEVRGCNLKIFFIIFLSS